MDSYPDNCYELLVVNGNDGRGLDGRLIATYDFEAPTAGEAIRQSTRLLEIRSHSGDLAVLWRASEPFRFLANPPGQHAVYVGSCHQA